MKGAPEIFRCSFLCHVVFGFSGLEGVHPPKDARDAQRRPGGLVDLQDRGVDAGGLPADLESGGEPREIAGEHRLCRDPDDAPMPARHANVAEERRASREDLLVRRLDVRVGAEDSGDASVQVKGQGLLLRRRLRMEVHEDGERVPLLRPQFLQEGVRAMEGAVDGGHEHPSLKVDEPQLLPVALQDGRPGPRALYRYNIGFIDCVGRWNSLYRITKKQNGSIRYHIRTVFGKSQRFDYSKTYLLWLGQI